MKTIHDIEYDRSGTVWGALCLFIMVLLGAIFFGSVFLYMWALDHTKDGIDFLLYPLTSVLIIGCISPGVFTWKLLRAGKQNRYAALYGLIVADAIIIMVPVFLGVPFASYPK